MKTKQEQDRIIKLYVEDGLSSFEIAKVLNMSKSGVSYILKKNNIDMNIKNRNYDRRSYFIDDNFFEDINTEEKAYFLGFIMADGYVGQDRNIVTISVREDDIEILKNFQKAINTNYPIRYNNEKYPIIHITSKKIVSDLVALGVVQAKTNILKMPKINQEFYHHLIRGYFDGDGSIWLDKQNNQYRFQVLGTIDVLENFAKVLNLKCNKLRKATEKCDVYRLSYSGNQKLIYIMNIMYKDSKIYLNRKYNKFVNCKKLAENNYKNK